MPKKFDQRSMQTKIIGEMVNLRGIDPNSSRSITAAAKYVSCHGHRFSNDFGSISFRTVMRWYCHRLDFGNLPCETKWNIVASTTLTSWTEEQLAYLKSVVDEVPISYLDEIAANLNRHYAPH